MNAEGFENSEGLVDRCKYHSFTFYKAIRSENMLNRKII
jgi:hypothetical protein